MGINYYWLLKDEKIDDMDPKIHIGKKSSGGKYCKDCGITFCMEGTSNINKYGDNTTRKNS